MEVKTKTNAYNASKVYAEDTAWDYVKKLPDEEKFELITVHPAFILGPPITKGSFSSEEVMRKVLTGGFPGLPKTMISYVDVRDCAAGHLAALAQGKDHERYILSGGDLWFKEIGEFLHENWTDKGFRKIVRKEVSSFVFGVASIFLKEAKTVKPMWGKQFSMVNKKSIEELGIEYRPFSETANEMIQAMIDLGYVQPS